MCVCFVVVVKYYFVLTAVLVFYLFCFTASFFIQRQRYFCFFSSSVCVYVCVWFSFLITTFGYFFCLFFILYAAVKHARAFTMFFFFLSVFCVCVKLSVLPFHSLFSFFLFVFSSFFWDLNLNYLCVNIYTLFILQKSVFFIDFLSFSVFVFFFILK